MAQSISVANKGAFGQLISKDFKSVFFDEYKRTGEEYKAVANIGTMDSAYERYGQMVGFGSMQRITEGMAFPYDDMLQGSEKTITPQTFGLGFAVTQEMYEDDQTGHMKKAFKELGKAAALTRELIFWDVLNAGFVTTNRTGIDGSALFAAHTLFGTGGTYSNYAGTAGSLSLTTLQAMLNRLEKTPNDKGIAMPLKGKLLVVPPELRFEAERLLKSEYNPNDAYQNVNTVGNKGIEFMTCHYLTSTTAYFLLTEKQQHDLQYVNRIPLSLTSSDDFDTGTAKFKARMRANAFFLDWRGTDGNAGA